MSDFIRNVENTVGTWQPPQYPQLTDSAWEEAWARASETTKSNLAHAWWWVLTQQAQELDSHTFRTLMYGLYQTQFKWLRELRAYAPIGFVEPPHLQEHIYSPLQALTIKTEETHGYLSPAESKEVVCQTMWFGEPTARLTALLSKPDLTGHRDGPWPVLVPAVAWETACLPGASKQHQDAAKAWAFQAGLTGHVTSDHVPPEVRPWQDLGNAAAFTWPTGEIPSIDQHKALLADASPWLAMEVSQAIIKRNTYSTYDNNKHILANNTLLEWMIGSKLATGYELLGALAPQCKGGLDACEALGLSWEQACVQVQSMPTPTSASNLPEHLAGAV